MANRFTRDSSAEMWTHLEALSREGVRWFATTAARDAEFTAPVAGMSCYVGSGAAMDEWVYSGTAWKLISSTSWRAYVPAVVGLPVTIAEARWCRAGGLITCQVRLGVTGAATAGISVGLPVAPRAYDSTQSVGSAMAVIGAGIHSPAGVVIEGSGVVFWAGDTGRWGSGANRPAAWVAGSVLSMTVQYEPAA